MRLRAAHSVAIANRRAVLTDLPQEVDRLPSQQHLKSNVGSTVAYSRDPTRPTLCTVLRRRIQPRPYAADSTYGTVPSHTGATLCGRLYVRYCPVAHSRDPTRPTTYGTSPSHTAATLRGRLYVRYCPVAYSRDPTRPTLCTVLPRRTQPRPYAADSTYGTSPSLPGFAFVLIATASPYHYVVSDRTWKQFLVTSE